MVDTPVVSSEELEQLAGALHQVDIVSGHLDAVVLPVGAAARWPVPAWPPQAGASTSTAPSPAPCPL
ncbi:hypothetical protein ACFW9L_13695 [Streptomyces sp. NPDC059517]|uniref:hypothetical protein n=1 Tax=Streptomyces sp. NPDC059517 TaxID=3346855 RepID=UPI0036854375